MSKCSIPDCESPKRANGYCNKHNLRLRKYGDPLGGVKNHAPPEERFWRFVQSGPDCWLWKGRNNKRYGLFQIGGKGSTSVGAHRFSYEMHHGPIPAGLVVMHKCDMPLCVNPAHLEVGTHKENTADMIRKGRKVVVVPVGEKAGSAKLTDELVREMRLSDDSHAAWARRLAMAQSCIHSARIGKTWKHVETPPRGVRTYSRKA